MLAVTTVVLGEFKTEGGGKEGGERVGGRGTGGKVGGEKMGFGDYTDCTIELLWEWRGL